MGTRTHYGSVGWLLLVLSISVSARGQETTRFTEVANEVGLSYLGPVYAAAATDFDADGWIDLAISNHGELRLFRNRQGQSFANLGNKDLGTPGDTHGLSWVDLDDDGWLDLYLSVGAARGFGQGPNRVYRNLAGQGFEQQNDLDESLADPLGRGRCSLPWDMDGDGQLEFLILNTAGENRPHRLLQRTQLGWLDRAKDYGLERIRAECMTALMLGNLPTFVAYGNGPDSGRIFRLDRAGQFRDVTRALGETSVGTIFAVSTGDFDNDGDADLYLVRGHGIPPAVRVSEQSVEFRLIDDEFRDEASLRLRTRGRLTVEFDLAGRSDPTRIVYGAKGLHPRELPWQIEALAPELEGRPDIGSLAESALIIWSHGEGSIEVELIGVDPRRRAASGRLKSSEDIELLEEPSTSPRPQPNRLLENRQSKLVDISVASGTDDPRSGRDAVFFDMDNDGDLDLFVVNGGTAFANQPDVLYRNNGDMTFTEVTDLAGVSGPEKGRGSSVVALDYDNDGDLDLFTTNGDGPPLGNRGPYSLFRNNGRSHGHAKLELIGSSGNRVAVGSQLIFRPGDRMLHLQRVATSNRFSTSVLPFHLGLNDVKEAEVDILWSNGTRQTVTIGTGEHRTVVQKPRKTPD